MSKVIKNPTRKRQRVFNKTGGKCFYCEVDLDYNANVWAEDRTSEYHMDHFIPKSKGGTSVGDENYVPACYQCNARKGDFVPEEFLRRLIQKREEMKKELSRTHVIIENLKNALD